MATNGDHEGIPKRPRLFGDAEDEKQQVPSSIDNKLEEFSDSDSTSSASPSLSSLFSDGELFATITQLSKKKACEWNDYSEHVFSAFRVSSYIVCPVYILCMSVSPAKVYKPTVTYYLTKAGTASLPSWNSIEEELMKISPLFDGCESLPYALRNFKNAEELINTFSTNLKLAQEDLNQNANSPFDELLSGLSIMCRKLKNVKENCEPHEAIFVRYLWDILMYFKSVLSVPITIMQKETLELDLNQKKERIKKESKTMDVEPDIVMRLKQFIFLVVEVKKSAYQPKEFDAHKGHRVTHDSDQKTEVDPADLSSDFCGTESSAIKSTVPASGSSSGVDDAKGEPQENPISDEELEDDSLRHKKPPYRKLDSKEKEQIRGFLPQLLCEMLASMSENGKSRARFRFCRENEIVQLGLSMNGFKVRFIRLVLRHVDSNQEPSVECLRDPNVRCDVFLTQEFNLFKTRHVKKFYQILFAICLTSRTC